MRLSYFLILALVCTLAFAAPQQPREDDEDQETNVSGGKPEESKPAAANQQNQDTKSEEVESKPVEKKESKPVEEEEEDSKPVELPKPTQSPKPAESSKPSSDSEDDSSSDVRREEHKKIVPFQFHRVCRELDLKRPNCSCVWESTYEEGLDQASEKTRACKKDTEEEISECLNGFPGYEQCLANPSFEHHRPTGTSDDLLSRKCQEFALSDVMCTCLKDRDSNDALKTAIHACKDDAKKAEVAETKTKSKRAAPAAKAEVEEKSEHSQVKAGSSPVPAQQKINKECVIAALNANCKTN